jgi:hypothetical protein
MLRIMCYRTRALWPQVARAGFSMTDELAFRRTVCQIRVIDEMATRSSFFIFNITNIFFYDSNGRETSFTQICRHKRKQNFYGSVS